MPEAVYRMMTLLCALVGTLPIGTNLGLLHLLWMLTSGRLLASRGQCSAGCPRVACPRGRPAGHGQRWGKVTGRARSCSDAGRRWLPGKGSGSRRPMVAITRWRSI